MTASRVFPALALAAGLFLAAGGSTAQQPKLVQPIPKVVPFPPAADLPVVPKSAGAFLTIKVSDVMDHPDLRPVLEQLKKTPDALEGVTELFGVAPDEMDRLTLFWPAVSPRGPDAPVVVLTTREAYNEARVLRRLKAAPVFDDGGVGGAYEAERRARDQAEQNLKRIEEEVRKYAKDAERPPLPPLDPKQFDPELLKYLEKKDVFPLPEPGGKKKSEEPGKSDPAKKEPPKDDGPTFPIAATLPAEPLFYEMRGGGFELLILADERTLVFIPGGRNEFGVMSLLAQMIQKRPTGPLADAIKDAANHTLAAGLYLPPVFREFARGMPPELAPYAALTAAKTGTITGDLGKAAKFTLRLAFDDATAARRAAPVLEEGVKEFAAKMGEEVRRMKDGRGPEKAFAPLAESLLAGLKKATVKAEGTAVVASGEVNAGPAAATAVADLLQSIQGRKRFIARSNDLKQIGIALHAYHDATGKLPTNSYGPKGEPLLSWRVQLLPFLEHQNLYQQFNLKEPWDGPTNKKLIEQMPKVFEATGREGKKGHTYYQAFVSPDPAKRRPGPGGPGLPGGPGVGQPGDPGFGQPFGGNTWLIEGDKNTSRLTSITDGTSNTIAVVEAREGVVWSKPDDLRFGEKFPPLGEPGADRFMALFLDGHIGQIPTTIKPDILRALLTANGGEPVSPDFDDGPRGFRLRGRVGDGASMPPVASAGDEGGLPPRPAVKK